MKVVRSSTLTTVAAWPTTMTLQQPFGSHLYICPYVITISVAQIAHRQMTGQSLKEPQSM